jgi:carbonic anhydrase
VHQSAEGALAVVAVMFEIGKEQSAISRLWYQMPEKAGDSVPFGGKLTAAEVLPPKRDYYYFSGSLTTPPCSEGVSWIVLKHPVQVSSEEVEQFSRVIGHPNNRPVQPKNARIVDD